MVHNENLKYRNGSHRKVFEKSKSWLFSCVQLFGTPQTSPLGSSVMEFSRKEY